MRICDSHIFHILPDCILSHISAKCRYWIFFPHKLAFSMAIVIFIVFLLPISIRFLYLDHLVANRMVGNHVSGPLWNEMG